MGDIDRWVYDIGSGRGYGRCSGNGNGSGYGYGSGSGNGYGSGCGHGSGSGDGSGCGHGSGSGSGNGNGSGYGSGRGSGIKSINGMAVYDIDKTETIIYSIFGNYAKGAILRSDLTLSPCYIAKQDGFYAHGNTIREAREALEIKLYEDMPQEERIEAFVSTHDLDKSYPTMEFFGWHNRLTGSCEMGRREFAKEHNIDLNGSMITREFLELTKDAYGGEIIRETMEAYGK